MYHRILGLTFQNIIQKLPSSKWRIKCLLIFLLLLLSGREIYAQNRLELENKRTSLEQEIQYNSTRLQNIKKDKNSKLEQYLGIKTQVETRRNLVQTFQEEINLLDKQLSSTATSMDSLIIANEKMKKQYAALLQSAYIMKTNESDWQFIFSAASFNDAYKRWQYLQQYQSAIKQYVTLLKEAQIKLNEEQSKLSEQKNSKLNLLGTQKEHFQKIEKELKLTDQLIKKLDKNEKKLAANIEKQKREFKQLNASIEKIIQDEILKQKKKSSQQKTVEKEIATKTTNDFSNNKGHLPWPVSNGKIVSSFGRHPHPKIKSVEIINNGIDIKSQKGANVSSVYAGKVVGTQIVPGYKNTLIIRHSNYYTVYSNMKSISVKRGQNITQGQKIGTLGSDASLHFEIWHNKKRVNPIHWIR